MDKERYGACGCVWDGALCDVEVGGVHGVGGGAYDAGEDVEVAEVAAYGDAACVYVETVGCGGEFAAVEGVDLGMREWEMCVGRAYAREWRRVWTDVGGATEEEEREREKESVEER